VVWLVGQHGSLVLEPWTFDPWSIHPCNIWSFSSCIKIRTIVQGSNVPRIKSSGLAYKASSKSS
jgi:hypothetical protein